MQSLLVLYLTHQLLLPEHAARVLALAPFRAALEGVTGPLSTAALASQIFGLYTGLVYLTPVLGGYLADRWLGKTVTVTIGAILMAAGHLLMAFDPTFLIAITLLLIGVGCFKGNIAGQVGDLYDPLDRRRATAFQIFQLAISISVIVSPLVCGTLGEKVGWHYGFAAAALGMAVGLGCYLHGRRWLPRPAAAKGAVPGHRAPLTREERRRMLGLVALLPVLAGAMVGNQQMFNAFVVWGEQSFDLNILGYEMPVTWLLSFDAVISVACQLLTIAFWQGWGRRRQQPDDLLKVAMAGAVMAAAPLLLTAASVQLAATGARVSIGWGLGFEIVNEIGFATFVPVGLSYYSRSAPARYQGLMIGVFYLQFFLCNLTVGRLGGLLEVMPASRFWSLHAGLVGAAAGVLLVLAFAARRATRPASA